MLSLANDGCPGHGPNHLFLTGAATVGFVWDLHILGWCRPGLPCLSSMYCPVQHFRMRGVVRFLLICALGRVSGVVPF